MNKRTKLDGISLSDLKCFTRIGKLFYMLHAYFDESVSPDKGIMCVGGVLAPESTWRRIEPRWAARVKIDSDKSVKDGLKPQARYHATDCASMVNEYAGWKEDRQVRLTKRLLDVIGAGNKNVVGAKPILMACGISYSEMRDAFPQIRKPADIRWHSYKLCMAKCLQMVADIMRRKFPDDLVTVIYDRTTEFDTAAQSAKRGIFPIGAWTSRYVVAFTDGGWEKYIALQPADLVAFEGYKLTESCKHGTGYVRRSVQGITQRHIPIALGFYTPQSFLDYKAIMGNSMDRNAVD
jgi:hypothetical protein